MYDYPLELQYCIFSLAIQSRDNHVKSTKFCNININI